MAGHFELIRTNEDGYRVNMLDADGSLMAVSVTFPTKEAAISGIARAREIAGTGLVKDRTDPSAVTAIAGRRKKGQSSRPAAPVHRGDGRHAAG